MSLNMMRVGDRFVPLHKKRKISKRQFLHEVHELVNGEFDAKDTFAKADKTDAFYRIEKQIDRLTNKQVDQLYTSVRKNLEPFVRLIAV